METNSTFTSDDPVITDPDKYRVIYENDVVRILKYDDNPEEITNQHKHPKFFLYALNNFKRKLHFPDGKSGTREIKAGDVITSEGEIHIGENVGDTPTHVLIVEFKDNFK